MHTLQYFQQSYIGILYIMCAVYNPGVFGEVWSSEKCGRRWRSVVAGVCVCVCVCVFVCVCVCVCVSE